MKTEISRFCATCAESITTLPAALDAAAAQFERRGAALRAPLAALNDVRARLRSLTEKLHNQQAYLLIFGPLKSGKSTLMNAISGTYVSEVTSLPGYPCLVFVQHGGKESFSITRYNGRESSYPNAIVLNDVVTEAHHALAQNIRASEEHGETFDPRTTYPDAIRRIDIKLPVPSLAESSTVLVDTPGLYSRMNFGYDVLTREFRDSAACAVFVVKTDNLFLEQVFTEFNQLLDLFSRIFIVVNVDASKRDLAPDGTLRPSAESESPQRVIEAFTTLSMAGPLREAYEAGRVRIHAVDLLGAASSFLSGNGKISEHRAPFDEFVRDLTDFLNSSDYTREFIQDSLRQAATLSEESRAVAAGEEIHNLRQQQERRVEHMRELDAQIAATDRLVETDWATMFQSLRDENQRGAEELARARTAQLREEMRHSLSAWLSSNESLEALSLSRWTLALTSAASSLASQSAERIQRLASHEHAGMTLPESVLADMRSAGFSTTLCAAHAMSLLGTENTAEHYPLKIAPSAIPVGKTLLDWLFFRSTGKVRRRFFGADGKRPIPSAEKEKRLRGAARAEFERLLTTTVDARFPALPLKFSTHLSEIYATRCASEILASLHTLREKLARERESLRIPFEMDTQVIAAAAQLENLAESVSDAIEQIAIQEKSHFNQTTNFSKNCEMVDCGIIAPISQIAPLPLL